MKLAPDSMIRELQLPGWEIYPKFPLYVLFEAPSITQAHLFLKRFSAELRQCALSIDTYVGVKGSSRVITIPSEKKMVNQQPVVLDPAAFHINRMRLSRPLLAAIAYYLENPEIAAGIVSLKNERQCALSLACSQYMPSDGATVQQATNWRRGDYWHLGDLVDFRKESAQWSANDGEWHDYGYRTFDPLLGVRSQDGWSHYLNRFKLIADDEGNRFHICENLERIAIARPAFL